MSTMEENHEIEPTGSAELVPVVFRLQFRVRSRQGVRNEVLVKTQDADPAQLTPLRLQYQNLHDGRNWVTLRRSVMDFELESYDADTQTATYRPYDIARSDKRREQLVTGWGFRHERPHPVVSEAEQ